jgi:hypothetical protein
MEKSTSALDLKCSITFVFCRLRCVNIISNSSQSKTFHLCRNTASRSLFANSGTMSGSNSPTSSNRSSKGDKQVCLGNQCSLLPVTSACKCMGEMGTAHCKESTPKVQIFPEMKLRGLSLNSYVHVSMSDLYIPKIGLPTLLQKIGGPIVGIYKSLTNT